MKISMRKKYIHIMDVFYHLFLNMRYESYVELSFEAVHSPSDVIDM